jgi:HAE1 family hydrophobic/amphiphilic exporter-1
MQKLAEISVRRPVFATMLIAALTVVGGVCFFTLGVDRFPRVEVPAVSVQTTNPGATPESIETEVTDRIEAAVNTVAGIDELRSASQEGQSRVSLAFNLSKDPDIAAQEVRAKVDPVIRSLPDTADPPTVQKQDPDASPVILYSISGPMPVVELTTYIEQNVKKRLESVDGVGEILLFGSRRREVQVQIDPNRLESFGLTTNDVANALAAQNMELPGGNIEAGAQRLSVRTLGRVSTPTEFEDVVIASVGSADGQAGSTAVRVRDIGVVVDGGAEPGSVTMLNGSPAITVAVRKQSGVNTVALTERIKERMKEVRATLPPTFKVELVRDDSFFINAALHAIQEHLLLGGLFAALVVFLFLRNLRSTLIAAIAIPTSVIGAFALMAALDYTLNQMTMLALTLMVGIVIDDAIVVLENIYRFVEEKGLEPMQAAVEGTKEIGLAVMATTLSLLAVFVPVGFMPGTVGRFMSSFGLTSAAAIAISLLVSFTLTPMLAARFIQKKKAVDPKGQAPSGAAPESTASATGASHEPASRAGFYGHIDRFYMRMLEWAMGHRKVVVGICVLVMASTVPLFKLSGLNFVPIEDEARFQITLRTPVGTSLAATASLAERVARDIREHLPGVANTLAIGGGGGGQSLPNQGTIHIPLVPREERAFSQQELMAKAREIIKPYRQSAVFVVQISGGFGGGLGGGSSRVQYALVGPDLARLDEYTAKAADIVRKNPAVLDVDRSYLPGKPEVRVDIDRQRAADLGIRVADVARTVNALMAGQRVTTYNSASDQYDVVLKAQEPFRRSADTLANAKVRTANGQLVPLRNLATIRDGSGPATIDRLDRQRQITLSASWAKGSSQAQVQEIIQQAFDSIGMQPGYRLVASGQSRELERGMSAFGLAFLLSFAFMYMVLASQFESFIHPITILLTLPLAVPFGLLASLLLGQQLNIYSALGVLLLFGIVKKNAILQVDHTLGLRAKGMPRDEAIRQANRDRLRPILMTTMALIAGMIPLCVGSGPGAETNRAIGLLVVGGQSLCLLLTLLAVPVFYSLFEDLAESPAWSKMRASLRGRFRRHRESTALLLTLAFAGSLLAGSARAQTTAVADAADTTIDGSPLAIGLDEAIRLALENNHDLAISRLDVDRAAADLRAARGLFDPILAPDASRQDAENPVASAIGGSNTGRIEQDTDDYGVLLGGKSPLQGGSYSLDLGATRLESSNLNLRLNPQWSSALTLGYTQPLLRGRSIDLERRQVLLARSLLGASRAELERQLAAQITGVESAWFDLVFARDNLAVQRTAAEQALRQVNSNERQMKEGALALIDVVEARTQAANFEQRVATAELDLERAQNALKAKILSDPADPRWNRPLTPAGEAPARTLPERTPEALRAAIARAATSRPEIQSLEEAALRNRVEIRYFENAALPRVDLVATYSYAGLAGSPVGATGAALPDYLKGDLGDSFRNVTDRRFPTSRLGVVMSLPLGNRTARAQADSVALEGRQLEHQRRALEQAIGVEVRNALQAIDSAERRLRAASSARRGAEEQYDSEQRRFESGLATVFLVLERQAALVEARAQEVRAKADLAQALTEYDRATGSILERSGVATAAAAAAADSAPR